MKGQHSDRVRLNHIMDAINAIEGYVTSISFEEFSSSSEKTFATVKQLEIIGEAANRISEKTRDLQSNIEWAEIIALRNILVHEYFIIDHSIIWEIVEDELVELKIRIEDLLNRIK